MKTSGAFSTFVALMRGINVGGNNQLPMKELAAIFAREGCEEVRTYIQSGNVVFRAPSRGVERLASAIARRILEQHGLTTPVVLRSEEELAAVARDNPFLRPGEDSKPLHVLFLADVPEPGRVAALDPARSPPDAFAVRGREVYLHCPNGVGKTRLTNAYFDSALKTVSTGRNWNTVLKLRALAAEVAGTSER